MSWLCVLTSVPASSARNPQIMLFWSFFRIFLFSIHHSCNRLLFEEGKSEGAPSHEFEQRSFTWTVSPIDSVMLPLNVRTVSQTGPLHGPSPSASQN